LAIDCWSSPQRVAFIAIIGYFIDCDWQYREVLLGFEHLPESHEGLKLAEKVIHALERYELGNRVLAITTDNASNNHTMIEALHDALKVRGSPASIIDSALDKELDNLVNSHVHIPCLAHVLQLSAKALLSYLKVDAKNNEVEKTWDEKTDGKFTEQGIPHALEKVSEI
jgi:hypothetical protein